VQHFVLHCIRGTLCGRGCTASGERRAAIMSDRFFVYILASRRNGTLYVGVTNDLSRRMMQHRAKAVPGFTRRYGVDKLMYFEEYESILEARAREHSVKRWRRAWKIALIEKLNPQWRDLADELVML
jgi:putative endonuclease